MPIFSTLSLYIIRRYFFWTLLVFSFVILAIGLFEFIELLRRSMSKMDVRLLDILGLTALKIPLHIQLFFPFACMVVSKITLWKLNQTQEIIAARSLGLSTFQIIKTLLFSVFILSIFNLSVLNPLSAIMQKKAEIVESKVFNKSHVHSQFALNDSGLWLREKIEERHRTIYIKRYNIETNDFKDIHIFETDYRGVLLNHYVAESASISKKEFLLNHVFFQNHMQEETKLEICRLNTSLSMSMIEENNAKPETISFWYLPAFIGYLYQSGLSTVKYELHWYAQLSKIFQSLALVLLAAAFCMHPTRYQQTSVLILIGLITGFTLHFLTDIIHAFGLSHKIPIMLAAFSPSILTFCVSLGLFMHVERG